MSAPAGRLLPNGLAVLLVLATLGEGGGSPEGLLAVHTGLAALLLAALLRSERGEARAGTLPAGPAALYALFLFVAALSAARSPYAYAALLAWTELLVFGAVSWLGARCGAGAVERIAQGVLAGGAVQGLTAVVQAAGGESRPAGTFLNASHLGAWLVAALLLALPATICSRGAGLATRVAALLPVVAGLYLVRSRGALVGLAAGAALLFWTARRRIGRRGKVVAAVLGGGLLLLVGAGVAARLGDPFSYHRVRIWKASLGCSLEHAWMGAGPGQFAAAADALRFPAEEGPLRFERRFSSTHSDFLRLPAEVGWPATALALGAAAWAAARIRAGLRAPAGPAATGAAAALAALVAQAAVENLSVRPAVYLLAAVLLGGLLSVPAPGTAASRGARAAAALFVLGVYVACELVPYLAFDASRGLPRGRLDPASRARLSRALALNPLHPDLWMRRAEDLAGGGTTWTLAVYAEAREFAERALRLQPADAGYRLRRARIEALACFTLFRDEKTRARAAAAFDEASRLSPKDATILLEKGRFQLRAGDPAGARRAAEHALRLEPEGVTPRLLLAEALLASEEPAAAQSARRALAEAVEKAKRWASEPRPSPYARALLDLDTAKVEDLRRRLELRGGGLRGEPGSSRAARSPARRRAGSAAGGAGSLPAGQSPAAS